MALPLESALSVGLVSLIPSRKLASAILEVGPRMLFSHHPLGNVPDVRHVIGGRNGIQKDQGLPCVVCKLSVLVIKGNLVFFRAVQKTVDLFSEESAGPLLCPQLCRHPHRVAQRHSVQRSCNSVPHFSLLPYQLVITTCIINSRQWNVNMLFDFQHSA